MTISDSINLIIGLLTLLIGAIMFWSLPIPFARNQKKHNLPFVSIIIPARNEANRIKPLLESLKKQNFKDFEVLVVDDHSTDNTSAIAAEYGATVIQNKSESSLGAGKSLACFEGAKQARGKWLLFIDADTYFTKANSLESLLLFYNEKGATGIISLQPDHTIYRLYENLSAIFNIIMIVGMNVFTVWKQSFKTAGSFGPLILCNKAEYFLTGGHEKIAHELLDDLALGEAFLAKNLSVDCLGGKGTVSSRMYPEGFKSLVEGWSKSLAVGSKSTHPLIMLMVIIWISGSFITTGALISSFISANLTFIVLSSALYLLFAFQTAWFARRCGDFKWFIFLFYPLLFLFFVGIFLYSLFRVYILRSVKWKGRKIDI